MTVPTYEDLFTAGERAVTLIQSPIGLEAVRAQGSNVNLTMVAAATMGQEIASYAQREFAACFLETAAKRQTDLERWAYSRYQLRPQRASAAVVPLTLSRTDRTTGFTVAAGSVFATPTGIRFEILNDVPFAVRQAGPIAVSAVAQAVGTSGNVGVGTITEVVSPQEDSSLLVTNLERAAGGTGDQTTVEFAAVAQSFFVAAQRGTYEAIRAAVLRVPGVTSAYVDQRLNGDGQPVGINEIVIADASGGGNSVLAARVLLDLRRVRGLGVPCLVSSGSPAFVAVVVVGLAFRAGFDSTTVLADARVRVLAAINALSPTETLERSAIIAALKSTPGLLVPEGALIEPAGDYVPAAGEVLRATPDRISLNGLVGQAVA